VIDVGARLKTLLVVGHSLSTNRANGNVGVYIAIVVLLTIGFAIHREELRSADGPLAFDTLKAIRVKSFAECLGEGAVDGLIAAATKPRGLKNGRVVRFLALSCREDSLLVLV